MERAERVNLWGWTFSSRVVLAALVLAVALMLATTSPRSLSPSMPVPALVIDPNTAPPEVLSALPKLGPVLIRRILAERDQAPFRSLDDLDARVRGIGPVTAAALRPYFRFPGDEPVGAPRQSLASRASP